MRRNYYNYYFKTKKFKAAKLATNCNSQQLTAAITPGLKVLSIQPTWPKGQHNGIQHYFIMLQSRKIPNTK